MLGDYNECIVKARQKPEYKQGDFLDSIEQLDYRVEDAGHTFHRLRNGRLICSGLDFAVTNDDGVTLSKQEVGFSNHAMISTKVEGKNLKKRRKTKFEFVRHSQNARQRRRHL